MPTNTLRGRSSGQKLMSNNIKISIGRPPICSQPHFNGKTNNIGQPTNYHADLSFLACTHLSAGFCLSPALEGQQILDSRPINSVKPIDFFISTYLSAGFYSLNPPPPLNRSTNVTLWPHLHISMNALSSCYDF